MNMDTNLKSKYGFDRMCRVCLSECPDMTNLYNSDRNIYEIIMTCSNVKLVKDDDLPGQVCKPCIQHADNALSFKLKCELSDAKLRSYITNPFLPSEMDIKEEQSLLGISEINDYFKYENQATDSIFTSLKEKGFNGFHIESSFLKYDCTICKNCFDSSKALVEHVVANHSDTNCIKMEFENHLCTICKRKYLNDFELKKHQASHKEFTVDGKKLVCPLCKEQFCNHESVLRHLTYHRDESYHECFPCKCFFKTKLHLKRHIKKRHPPGSETVEPESKAHGIYDPDETLIKSEVDGDIDDHTLTLDRVYNCKLDNDLDLGTDDLIASIGDANLNDSYIGHNLAADCSDLADSDYDADKFLSEIMDEADNKFYKKKKNSERTHNDEVTIKTEPDNVDDEDETLIKKNSRLSNHSKQSGTLNRKSNQVKMFSCQECPKRFRRVEHLEDHKKRHTGERSYLCSKCGKGYFKQAHLDKHMGTHLKDHGEKPVYSCPLCSRVVSHSNHLQAHMRTHKNKNGEPILPLPNNPNKVGHLCSTCGRSCSSRSNLAVHMRRHLGTKTCICKICGKGYPRTTDLTLHMRQHTGERPFICTLCNRAFARSDKLAIHMRTHTGEKPYTCSVCGRAFAQSNDLSTHKKRNTCSNSGGTITLSGICNSSETEDHLLLLAQNSQLEVTPIEASLLAKGHLNNEENNQNYYKAKRKKTDKLERAINLATNIISNDDQDKLMPSAQTRALAAATSPNHLFSISANAASNSKVNDGDSFDATKNVSDLIKHSFIVPDLMATQRALEFASGSHNNVMAHQRVELTDFTTAALLQIQSAHFGLR